MTLHPEEAAVLARKAKAGALESGIAAGNTAVPRVSDLDRDNFLIIFERDTELKSAAELILTHYREFRRNPEASMRGPYRMEGSQNYYLLEERPGNPLLEVLTLSDPAKIYNVNCGPFLSHTNFQRFHKYLKEK